MSPTPNPTLRLIAWFSLAYSLVGLSSYLSYSLLQGLPYWQFTYQRALLGNLSTAAWLTHFLSFFLLLAGSLSLLLRKPLGRTLLLLWAITHVSTSLLANTLRLVEYASAATHPANTPTNYTLQFAVSLFSQSLLNAAFPLFTLTLLLSPPFKNPFPPTPQTGFEILPTASLAPTESP